eukprot:CAMPEP_0185202550 /NCGR_PEP_ID=MMETSP1140-20130426/51324_1 /TAXON_ID=298111 /ORGANISM="Pavlova sp., Strain CCMP459" /LENGTH=95 /DNA_ID=CAMNT_0027769989 /DNA_START=75 /DNA_END=359 /DNA_ORIENTATION=+
MGANSSALICSDAGQIPRGVKLAALNDLRETARAMQAKPCSERAARGPGPQRAAGVPLTMADLVREVVVPATERKRCPHVDTVEAKQVRAAEVLV